MSRLVPLAALILTLAATPALADGNAAVGAGVFHARCGICHSEQQGQNRLGPSLYGVIGRKAGTLAGYNYSDAMKNSGKTWDAATLDAYLTNPQGTLPGIRMTFPGLQNPADRANVIAYLTTLK